MPSTEQSAIASMIALRAEIESRLMKNPDYRAYIALSKAIHEVSPPLERAAAAPRVAEAVGMARGASHPVAIARAPSQPDAVAHILEQYGPQPTAELVPMVIDMGVAIGGKDKLINLSSAISKSNRFRTVRINGVSHWWFKDRELPDTRTTFQPDMDFGGETGAAAPAADGNSDDGGSDDAAA